MLDTETNVSIHPQDTAALIAEKGVRLESEGDVYYVRPSQVKGLQQHGTRGTTVNLFGGTYVTLYDLHIDATAKCLGWTD